MPATDPPGGGGFFTKKLGPFPMWVWIGLGVAGFYFYKSRQSASASTSSTDAATQALAQQGAAAAQYGYSGADLASMLSNLSGQVAMLGGGNSGTGQTTSTSPGSTGQPATTPISAGIKLAPSGGGYYVPGSTAPIPGQGGHTYEYLPTPGLLAQLPKGTQLYYQPAPNYFLPAPAHPVSGTPLFIAVS